MENRSKFAPENHFSAPREAEECAWRDRGTRRPAQEMANLGIVIKGMRWCKQRILPGRGGGMEAGKMEEVCMV
jgi:hypothetical protein